MYIHNMYIYNMCIYVYIYIYIIYHKALPFMAQQAEHPKASHPRAAAWCGPGVAMPVMPRNLNSEFSLMYLEVSMAMEVPKMDGL